MAARLEVAGAKVVAVCGERAVHKLPRQGFGVGGHEGARIGERAAPLGDTAAHRVECGHERVEPERLAESHGETRGGVLRIVAQHALGGGAVVGHGHLRLHRQEGGHQDRAEQQERHERPAMARPQAPPRQSPHALAVMMLESSVIARGQARGSPHSDTETTDNALIS